MNHEIELELIEPLYAKEGFAPTRKYYRRESADGRLYLSQTDFGVWNAYRSVTTALQMSYPPNPFLTQWQTNQGSHDAYVYTLNAAADYGTFMHACIVRFITSVNILKLNPIDVQQLVKDELNEFKQRGGYIIKDDWTAKALNDLYSFAEFYREKEVEILAVEVCVGTDNYLEGVSDVSAPVAGCIDCRCNMTFNKQRVGAIIDLKSGRKGFWESHVRQLGMYRKMWNGAYPDLQADMIFNWAPTDWRDKPTYKLENQTKKVDYKEIEYALQASFYRNPVTMPQSKVYSPIYLGEPVENFVTLAEFGNGLY